MLKKYIHGVNNINEAKLIISSDYDGIEVDFHLLKDGNFVSHHDYSVNGLNNRLRYMTELQLSEFRGDGTLENLHDYIRIIGNKDIIIDLKSWQIIKTAYPNTQEYAQIFFKTMKPYYKQNNIYIQSYDQNLIASIVKLNNQYKTNFKIGIIIRSINQLKKAISPTKDNNISFFAIRQKIINRFTVNQIKKEIPNIKILCWTERWEQHMSDPKIAENSNCDGIIYLDGKILVSNTI